MKEEEKDSPESFKLASTLGQQIRFAKNSRKLEILIIQEDFLSSPAREKRLDESNPSSGRVRFQDKEVYIYGTTNMLNSQDLQSI